MYKMIEASSLRNCLEKRPDDVSPEKCKGDPASSLESHKLLVSHDGSCGKERQAVYPAIEIQQR